LARTKSVQAFKDESLDLEARIVDAIRSVGPRNVSLISRMTGAHVETIRYKIKKQFRKLGFKIHADVDFKKLGLTLHWATFHFSRTYYDAASAVLRTLNEIGYLTYFAKIVPQGHYVALFAIPSGKTQQYRGFLSHLRKSGVFADFTIDEVLVSRHKSMDPKFFNFQSGKWDVEWNRVKEEAGVPLQFDGKESQPVADYYDLLLIKELQLDALQHVVAAARKLKVNQKTFEYHYRAHVLKKKLIPSYIVRWMQDQEKTLVHTVVLTRMTFRGLSQTEFSRVQRAVSKIPFLWAEEVLRDGTYITTLCIPGAELITTFSYLNGEVSDLQSKVEVGYIKPRESSLFTIPYNMFSADGWKFDPHHLERELAKRVALFIRK
jgi:DNA-binding Lrp family transcriptional regulator